MFIRIILSTLFISVITLKGYTQCPPNETRTNPENPSGNYVPEWDENPFINSDFNWFEKIPNSTGIKRFEINDDAGFNLPPGHTILSPYDPSMGANYTFLYSGGTSAEDRDHHWEDGWEVISINLGYYPNGESIKEDFTLNNASGLYIPGGNTNYDQNPYIILYNRYRGTLRVFATSTTNLNQGFSGVQSSIELIELSSGGISGILRRDGGVDEALDKKTRTTKLKSYNEHPNSSSRFWASDFRLSYDPCACNSQSLIGFSWDLFKESTLNIEGISQSVDADLNTNRTPEYYDDIFTNWHSKDSGANIIYQTANHMYSDYKNKLESFETELNRYENATKSETADIIDFVKNFVVNGVAGFVPVGNTLKVFLNKAKFFGGEEKELYQPYGKGIESIINGFSKYMLSTAYDQVTASHKDKAPTKPVRPIPPQISMTQTKMTGNISNSSHIDGPTMFNFGAWPTEWIDQDENYVDDYSDVNFERVPIYNEVPGLYATLKTPTLSSQTQEYSDVLGVTVQKNPIVIGFQGFEELEIEGYLDHYFSFKVDPIEYALNPALDWDLERTKLYVQLEVTLRKGKVDISAVNNLVTHDQIAIPQPGLGYGDKKYFHSISNAYIDTWNIENTPNDLENFSESIIPHESEETKSDILVRSAIIPFDAIGDAAIHLSNQYDVNISALSNFPGSGLTQQEAEELVKQYGYSVQKVELKIIGDFYFEQIGYGGNQVNTFQTFNYRFKKDGSLGLFEEIVHSPGQSYSHVYDFAKDISDPLTIPSINWPSGHSLCLDCNSEDLYFPSTLLNQDELFFFATDYTFEGNIHVEAPHKITFLYMQDIELPNYIEISGNVEFIRFSSSIFYQSNPIEPKDDSFILNYCNSTNYQADLSLFPISQYDPPDKHFALKHAGLALQSDLVLYPNPTTHSVYLKGKNLMDINSLRIFDLAGKNLDNLNKSMLKEFSFDVSGYNVGTYVIHVVYSDGSIDKKKLSIVR